MANRTVFRGLKTSITRLVLMVSLCPGLTCLLAPAVHAQTNTKNDTVPKTVQPPLMERSASAKPNLIDLTAYYNARLTEAWLSRPDNDLASLPAGLQNFGGVDYDVRGLIQLAGKNEATKRFPKLVRGIEINQKCARLHFLDAATFGNGVPDGTWVGSYVVHFASNQMQFEIPLYYGLNIRDWHALSSEPPAAKDLHVVWTGANKYSTQLHRSVRLFSMTWDNPTPGVEIKSMDFISAATNGAPFLIAITADRQEPETPAPSAARAELPPAKPEANPGDTAPSAPASAKPAALASRQQMRLSALGFFAGGLALFGVMRRRAARSRLTYKPSALIEAGTPAEGLVIASPEHRTFVHITMAAGTQTQSQAQPQSQPRPQPLPPPRAEPLPDEVRAGVIAQLTRWLKQKMVQRLVTDRAQLLDTQETAARKIMAVDERLSKIEQQIQLRNHEYEQRIDELEKELLTAQEENRELIRAKIALIKAEMEKERLKAEKYIKEHQQN